MYNNLCIKGYTFKQTSLACPEQYDIFDNNGDYVAYFRLRHGDVSVVAEDGEILVDESVSKDVGDGVFFDDCVRKSFFNQAINELEAKRALERTPCHVGSTNHFGETDLTLDSTLINDENGVVVWRFKDGEKVITKKSPDDQFDFTLAYAYAIAVKLFGSKNKFHQEVEFRQKRATHLKVKTKVKKVKQEVISPLESKPSQKKKKKS